MKCFAWYYVYHLIIIYQTASTRMIGQPVFKYMEVFDYYNMRLNMQLFREELISYVNQPNRQVLCDIYQLWDGTQVYMYNDRDDDVSAIEWDDEEVTCGYSADPWTTPILTNDSLSCFVTI